MNTTQDRFPVGSKVRFHAAFRTWHGQVDSYTPNGRAVVVTEEGRQFTLTIDQLVMMRDLAKHYPDPATEGILAAKRDAVALEINEDVIVNLTNMPAKVAMVGSDGQTVRVTFEDGHESIEVPAANVTRRPKSRFQYGDAVQMVAVGIPARVVGIPDEHTLEVVYDDIFGVFRIPAQYTLLVEYDTPTVDHKFKIGTRVNVGTVGVPATIVGFNGNDYRVSYDDMPLDDNGYPFTVPARGVSLLETADEALLKANAEIADMKRQIADLIKERTTLRYAMRQIVDYSGSRYTDDAEVMKEIAEAALDGENITPRR